MKKIIIENDIQVYCVKATSYPEGIFPAFKDLHSKVEFSYDRNYISFSRPEGGEIAYYAGATVLNDGEFNQLNLTEIILEKGTYLEMSIENYRENLSEIGAGFQKLIQTENIDPNGYCIEWYDSEKVMRCLIRVL